MRTLACGILLSAALSAHAQTLTVSPASVPVGGAVTATWNGIAAPTATDWIGLYTPGAANTAFLAWIYVSCTQAPGAARSNGSCGFTIPAGLGTYELRLLANNGYSTLLGSTALTITGGGGGGPVLSVSGAGGSVTATWSGIASPSPTDWIGVYSPGAANTAFMNWIYVSCSKTPGAAQASGSCSLVIPAGSELRLLANDGYSVLAVGSAAGNASTTVFYIHSDHLNTPRLITNQAGQVVWRWDNTEPFGDSAPTQSGVTCNLRFHGQYFDKETNLNYNFFRDYDPATGRYMESDPIGVSGGLNTYAYVMGNPLRYSDPSGLETYQCRRPLGGLPGPRTSPLFYHQYSCTRDPTGKLVCGGQGMTGSNWWSSPGQPTLPTTDYYNTDACRVTQSDNQCFESCLIEDWGRPRPRYGIPFGTDCQEYDDDLNRRCRAKCGLK
jgi:RHS repeat-associated protein